MIKIHLPEYTVSDSRSIFEAFSYSSTVDILDTGKQQIKRRFSNDIFRIDTLLVVCFFCFVLLCCFTSQVNSYGHCGTVNSPNHTFSWADLNKRLTSNSCKYFHLQLTTTLLEQISEREENDRRNYFMINLHESMGPDRDRTRDPWIAVVFDIGNNHKGQRLGHACVCVCVSVCVEGLIPSPIPKNSAKVHA